MKLQKDVTVEDWKDLAGIDYDDYIKPVIEEFERRGSMDRRVVLNPRFERAARNASGEVTNGGLQRFYSGDMLSRVLAYEFGRQGCLNNILAQSENVAGEPVDAAIKLTRNVFSHVPENELRVLDCGFGTGANTLLMWLRETLAEYTLADYMCPTRLFIAAAIRKYMPQGARFRFVEIGKKTARPEIAEDERFHLIASVEVLEHVIDPEEYVRWFNQRLHPGGILWLSTFFNDLSNTDLPERQHLHENNKFQDADDWHNRVRACGFTSVGKDPRGVIKIWQKN